MEPFKVTFTFKTPVICESDYPIHLDAILAWSNGQEAEKAGSETPWEDAEELSFALDYEGDDSDMVWKSSMLRFKPASDLLAINMVRKTDPEQYMRDFDDGFIDKKTLTRVPTDSGQQKAYQWLALSRWMAKAEAWGVGDIEEIKDLLTNIKFIGKQGRNGYGVIDTITVEPCGEADDLWKLRVLPNSVKGAKGVDYAPAMHCLRPPYWQKIKRVEAMEPIV